MPYVRGQNHSIFHLAVQPPGVAYSGRIVDEALRRVVHLAVFPDTTLAVARTYLPNDEFAVIWRFNQRGRIKEIDVEINALPAKSTRVLTVSAPDEAWTTVSASYTPIPQETNFINKHFADLSVGEKYYQLIRYGHTTAHKIHAHLENKTMLEAYFYIQGQRSLRSLPPSSPARKTLAATTALHPSHVGFPIDSANSASSLLTIEYVPFLKPHERTREVRQRLGIADTMPLIRQNI